MLIVHGRRYFLIHAFSMLDVGLSGSADEIVEVRQEYFHVFWIPLFATGKDWVVHKATGVYDLSNKDISHIISKAGKPKTLWYAYAGPVVCLGYSVAALLFSLFNR